MGFRQDGPAESSFLCIKSGARGWHQVVSPAGVVKSGPAPAGASTLGRATHGWHQVVSYGARPWSKVSAAPCIGGLRPKAAPSGWRQIRWHACMVAPGPLLGRGGIVPLSTFRNSPECVKKT